MVRGKWAVIFVMVVALGVRLAELNQPFVDPWSWRQSDVAAIARNFLENGFHFTQPQIDWAGNEPGFVGTEFPVLPFLAALFYKNAGVQEWIGRIQGVLFFVFALPFFFGLVRRIFGEVVAVWATFFYAFAPLSIVASRAFMPDVPSLSLAIIGMYCFLRWTEEKRFRWLVSSAVLVSLALLIKLPTAIIGAPILYLVVAAVYDRRNRSGEEDGGHPPSRSYGATGRPPLQDLFTRWELWFFAAVALIPPALWYWHAHRVALGFYPHHFFGAGGFRIMGLAWYWGIIRQTAFSSLTLVLFTLALVGAMIAPRGKFTRLFHWWFAAMALFVFVVGYGNRHQWYQLPLVPIAAVFAGCACEWVALRTRFSRALLAVGATLLIGSFAVSSFYCVRPLYRPASASLRKLGLELKEATTSNALVIAATDGDPTVFYYAHRKGGHF
ncbi:MAG TPA: glycosyltransferase family 39 protein, partial [Chthoniobacterales bacterium]